MKKYLLTAAILFFFSLAFAQPGKKTPPKEKPPTQKEMEDLMKETQKAMDEMDPEDKKMMDSLGIKLPDTKAMKKNMAGVTDAQLKKAYDTEIRIVPLKDAARIAAISKTPLTAGSIVAFISNANTATMKLLWPESKTLAEKIYTQLKTTGKNNDALGNAATGLWIIGRLQPALYIMAKVCEADATNNDNLANYASMLSMCGMQQTAIPMLNYLNLKYPGNSTILNNLGQAWFGLGDMDKAEKYLDSTIRIYAYHPQANLTKSFIEEEKGHKDEAVVLVKKSMLHAYSRDKEDRLRKLGGQLSANDMKLPPKPTADPFNLGAFTPPPFPRSVDECISLEPIWAAYRATLEESAKRLAAQYTQALKIANDAQEKRNSTTIAAVKDLVNTGSPQGVPQFLPLYAPKAALKASAVQEEYNRKIEDYGKKVVAFMQGRGMQLKKDYETAMEALHKEDDEQTGEGLANKDFCPKYKATSDKFLAAYNGEKENLFKEHLSIVKTYLNDFSYWQMYVQWPEMFEAIKLEKKMDWLGDLSAETPVDYESITQYKCVKKVPGVNGQLAQFDDIACKYHSELGLIFGSIKSDCSRMTSEIDLGFIKAGLKQDMDKETFADQFMNCNVEVGAEIGKTVKTGPLTVGASVSGRIGIEVDRNGISDIYTVGGIGASAGVGDVSINAGAEGKISLISGSGSIYGTGIFQK